MTVPRIETGRLVLRPWAAGDTRPYARLISDREVLGYMRHGVRTRLARGPLRILVARRNIGSFVEHWRRHGHGVWAVEESSSGELIGWVGLVRRRGWVADSATVEVGWLLGRPHWGRGYATEGARAALAFAFDRLGLERVISIARPGNERSRRVMDRLGLELQGTTVWRGEDVVWYAIDRVTAARPAARGPDARRLAPSEP